MAAGNAGFAVADGVGDEPAAHYTLAVCRDCMTHAFGNGESLADVSPYPLGR